MNVMNLSIIQPELMLVISAMALLMLGAFMKQNAVDWVLGGAGFILLLVGYQLTGQEMTEQYGFDSLIRQDGFIGYTKILIVFSALLTLVFAAQWLQNAEVRKFELPVLMLLAVFGLLMMVSSNDFLTLYMTVELSSLALYVMAAFDRDNLRSSEAGLKYFILGALASGMMLFGISLVYGFAGSTNFTVLGTLFAEPNYAVTAGLAVGLVLIIVGFCFKISAVPFHMWTPDVYEGAPTAIVAFFAVVPKIAALAIFARILQQPFAALELYWQDVIIAISIASMLVGAFGALLQNNIKRLLAYSSIGHMGYVLVGVAVGGEAAMQAVLIYLTLYVFMSVGTFGFVLSLKRNGEPVELISEMAGLSRTSPKSALFLAIMMFSMAGIPPLAGFFGKMYVFLAALEAGFVYLVVIGLLSSVVAAYYYLRVVKVLYFDEPKEPIDRELLKSTRAILLICAVVTCFFFISPVSLLQVTAGAAQIFR